jgi:hypothetical protein
VKKKQFFCLFQKFEKMQKENNLPTGEASPHLVTLIHYDFSILSDSTTKTHIVVVVVVVVV